jgi:hypothetical protein
MQAENLGDINASSILYDSPLNKPSDSCLEIFTNMASIRVDLNTEPPYVKPAEIYSLALSPTPPIRLRIATGGAGQSGLIRALAEAFITKKLTQFEEEPFSVAWLASDTSASFNYVASRSANLSITYHPAAEKIAMDQGIADRSVYAWRDHWLLVGT